MKKVLLLILLILAIGCTRNDIDNFTNTVNDALTSTYEKSEYIDNNPIKVGLYQKNKLVKELNVKYKDRTDIAVFDVYYTNEETLDSSNTKVNWNKYYKEYENIDEYKIELYESFKANGNEYENLHLNPQTQHKLHPYLYLYLYDAVHQTGRYSHLTMNDIKDNTIYTTIKLFLLSKSNEIESPITFSVFTYKDENDFIDGKYRGNSIYTIQINNK